MSFNHSPPRISQSQSSHRDLRVTEGFRKRGRQHLQTAPNALNFDRQTSRYVSLIELTNQGKNRLSKNMIERLKKPQKLSLALIVWTKVVRRLFECNKVTHFAREPWCEIYVIFHLVSLNIMTCFTLLCAPNLALSWAYLKCNASK